MENRFAKKYIMVYGITCLPAGRAVSLVFGNRFMVNSGWFCKWLQVFGGYCEHKTHNQTHCQFPQT